MPSKRDIRLDRLLAPLVVAMLFVGIGALGWLVGHVATYDALGQHHDHGTHAYMSPVQQGGVGIAVAGIALATLLAVASRSLLARWLERWRSSGSPAPWIAAASIPAATFPAVEVLEGSVGARGADLLALGLPLQAAIGIAVLAVARWLLVALVRVAGHLGGSMRGGTARGVTPRFAPSVRVEDARRAPMASGAPRRGPPVRVP